MSEALDRLLELRRRRASWGRRLLGIGGAALLHVLVVGGMLLGPQLFAAPPQQVQYVPVILMPAPALGRQQPARPRQPPTPAPTPPPAEAPAEQAAEPVPAEEPEVEPPRPEAQETPPPSSQEPAPAGPSGPRGAPGGSPDSPFTASFGTLDNPSFTYGYYLDRLLLLIRAQWSRPQLGGGPEAVVHFRILKDGRVEDVELVTSSGYSSFDFAALRAVQAAAPFPPLPRSYREGELGVNLIFR